MKKWLDKYQSKGEVKSPYKYKSQNLVNPNFNGLATTTYNITPKSLKVTKNNNKKRIPIKLQNQIFANNTRKNVLDNRRNYYFPYETEQTKEIRNLADDQVFKSSGDLISSTVPIGAIINALYQGVDQTLPAEGLRYLPNKIPFKQARGYNRLIPILKPASRLIDPFQMFDKLRIADSLYDSADSIDLYNQFKNGGLISKNSLNRTVTCSNCGWSWKLSDGGEDPLTCHKCGGIIKMKNGGELDEYKEKGEVKQSFRDQLLQRNGPVIDKTAAPILLPQNLNYDKTRVVNNASAGLNKTQLKNINQNLRNKAEQEKKQKLEEYRAAKLFHENNPVAKVLGTRQSKPTFVKPTAKELAYGLGAGINDFYDVPGIGIANDFVNPLSLVSKGIISPWAQAPLQAQQSDSYLPYLGAAASTALTVPMVRPASIAAKTFLNPKNIYTGALEAGNVYNNIATGNSIIPYAWKSPAAKLGQIESQAMFDAITQSGKLTEADKVLLAEYQYDSKPFTGRGILPVNQEKKEALQKIIDKVTPKFQNNTVLTRKINSNNPELFNLKNGIINIGDRPTSFSAGIGVDAYGNAADRIVLSGKNAKAVESNFLKNNYEELAPETFQNLQEFTDITNPGFTGRTKYYTNDAGEIIDKIEPLVKNQGFLNNLKQTALEKELIGSGFNLKLLGKVKNKLGGYDYIVKPILNKKQQGGAIITDKGQMIQYGSLTKYKEKGEVSFNPYANVNRVGSSDNTKVFRLNPEQVEKAKEAAAVRNEKIIKEYYQNQRSFIGPDKRTKAERNKSIAERKAYDDLMEKQKVIKQQPIYQTLQNTTAGGYNPNAAYNPVIGNTAGALGYTAAAALASPAVRPAYNFMNEAMNLPIQGVPGLTGNNVLNAYFGTRGLKSIMDGNITKPWKEAYRSNNPWDYANAASENAMTALELAPLIGPGYRGALEAGNYLTKKIPLKNTILAGALSKNLSFNKPNFNVEAPYIPKKIDPINRSTVNKRNDFLEKMSESEYDQLVKNLYNKYGDMYDSPIIEFKSSRPVSYMKDLNTLTKMEEASLLKEKFCLPDSECAKTANAVTNGIFTDITGKPFDAIGNAHNAWHMEDQMTRHGGVNLQNRVPLKVGDRILMGNNVNQSTYVPGYTADPRVRHAGVFAGMHELDNGNFVPMIFESGRTSPLYLNPLEYTFTGPNTALEAIRPKQFIDNTFGEALVDKNIRYAFRDKPAVAIYSSDNEAVQKVLNDAEPFRETIKKTYDITNDEFNELLNSLVSIGGQETKLNKVLPGSKLSKAKIQLQNSLNAVGLLKPIKQTINFAKQTANNVIPLTNSNLPLYPGSSRIEMEAAILAEKNGISFNDALIQIKNKYQPKPKFSLSTVEPSKGMFRQKYQTETDRLSNFGSNLKSKNSIENALGQMSENYNKAKKNYPNATPRQLMDITTLMWNSPNKALDKELVEFYIFGKNNPNPAKFNFDYVSKINKIKDKYINVKPQLVDPYLELLKNKKYPIIQYKQGGPIVTNRGQWDYPGQTTIIPSNEITMEGVPYPVLGVDNTGYVQMMQPQMNYTFPGQYVTEYPMMQYGGQNNDWEIIE